MPEETTTLIQKRAELKDKINNHLEKTLPAHFFHWIGKEIAKIVKLERPTHWSVSAVILGGLILVPGLLIAVLTDESRVWNLVDWSVVAITVFAYLAPIVSHVNVSYNLLPGIRDGLIDFIQTVEDLDKLDNWLTRFWSLWGWGISMIFGGLIYGILFVLSASLMAGKFIGIGMSVLAFTVGPFFVIPFWVIFKVLTLPSELSAYHFRLYESNPVNSEVVKHMLDILNDYFYLVAVYVAFATVIVSLHPYTKAFIFVCLIMGWGPSITQFFSNQRALKKIIASAKWRTLNSLQAQIRQLEASNLAEAPESTLVRINQLMDLHDRINATPNSVLNFSTGFSFLNQLILPLLGLLLGNFDKLIKMIIP